MRTVYLAMLLIAALEALGGSFYAWGEPGERFAREIQVPLQQKDKHWTPVALRLLRNAGFGVRGNEPEGAHGPEFALLLFPAGFCMHAVMYQGESEFVAVPVRKLAGQRH